MRAGALLTWWLKLNRKNRSILVGHVRRGSPETEERTITDETDTETKQTEVGITTLGLESEIERNRT